MMVVLDAIVLLEIVGVKGALLMLKSVAMVLRF